MDCNAVQFWNVLAFIVVKLLPIITECKLELPEKANSEILVTLFGIFIDCNVVHPSNAL